jgi:hypothetical protein
MKLWSQPTPNTSNAEVIQQEPSLRSTSTLSVTRTECLSARPSCIAARQMRTRAADFFLQGNSPSQKAEITSNKRMCVCQSRMLVFRKPSSARNTFPVNTNGFGPVPSRQSARKLRQARNKWAKPLRPLFRFPPLSCLDFLSIFTGGKSLT